MQADLEVTLALLAVRMLGGRVDPKTPSLRSHKKAIVRAQAGHLLVEEEIELPETHGKRSRKPKRAKILRLTPEGERHLMIGDPAALTATYQAHLAALRQAAEADRQTVRAELLSILTNLKPERSVAVAKALDTVAKKLAEVTALLNQPEPPTNTKLEEELLAKVETGFEKLLARIEETPAPPPPVASLHASPPEPALSAINGPPEPATAALAEEPV